jgi:alpha-1,6-mannosyltransferase
VLFAEYFGSMRSVNEIIRETPLFGRASTSAAILLGSLLLLHVLPWNPAVSYTLVFIMSSFAFLGVAYQTLHAEFRPKSVLLLVVAALLVRISFIALQPIGSDDVYRYMWDGRVQAAGINPYLYTPSAAELNSLHSPLLPASVNHPDMKTVYFPLSQWIFALCYLLSGEAIWGYKLILLMSECAVMILLFFLTKRLRLPTKYLLLYALCPLPIVQFAVDAHLDGLGLPLLLLGILLFLSKRPVSALVMMGLSISVKPVGLILLPIFFLQEKGWRSKGLVLLIPGAILLAQFLPYLTSSNPFEGLSIFAEHWTFNGVMFEVVNLFFRDNQPSRLLCAGLLIASLLFVYFSRREILTKIYLSIVLLFLMSPVVHPWYITWLAVILPLVSRWSGLVFVSTVSLTSFTILTYKLTGSWEQYPLVLAAEYLPVLILLIAESRKGRNPRATGNGAPSDVHHG